MNNSPKSPDDRDRDIGKMIRQLRHLRGLTQVGLATLLGVTFQQIQKYESGTNRIASGRLEQIAKALGVSVASFFEEGHSVPLSVRAQLLGNVYDRLSKVDQDQVEAFVASLAETRAG